MRAFWKKQQPTGNAIAVEGDFLKMLAAAIVVGTAFSAVAATIIMIVASVSPATASAAESSGDSGWVARHELLTQPSDLAESFVAHTDDDRVAGHDADLEAHLPAPGNLYFSGGCHGTILVAGERDVQITIKGNVAEVQIMQTFVVQPMDDSETDTAVFHAVLPQGASYSSFRVQSRGQDLLGQYAYHDNMDTDQTHAARQLQAKGLVRVYESIQPTAINALTSDTLFDIAGGETIVVTYRYQMPVEFRDGNKHLSVALADPRHSDDDGHLPLAAHPDTAVSVWVMWADGQTFAQPKTLLEAPRGLTLERRHGRIEGASWSAANVTSGDTFHLAWLQ